MKNNKLKKIICAALLCSTFAMPYMGSVEAAKAQDVKAEAQQTEKSQQEMQAKLTALEGKLKAVEADKTGETNDYRGTERTPQANGKLCGSPKPYHGGLG